MKAALVQAGGRSSRMRGDGSPDHKALARVRGRTLLEWNVQALVDAGFLDIAIAVSAAESALLSATKTIAAPLVQAAGGSLRLIVEEQPLGTIGAARECSFADALLVVNIDNLTSLDLADFLDHHLREEAAMTVATHIEGFQIPYGEALIEEERLIGIIEKPIKRYRISSGTYVLSAEAAALIDAGESIGAPTLFERVLSAGGKAAAYPHDRIWIDINAPEDLRRAEALLSATPAPVRLARNG